MARIKGPRKVHRYSAEFKLKAVKLSQIEGVQVQDVADALDIHPFMLSRWRKEAREGRLKAPVAVAPEARAQQPRDLHRVAPVGLDPVAGAFGDQRRGDDQTVETLRPQVPMEHIGAGTGFVGEHELRGRGVKPANQLVDVRLSTPDRSHEHGRIGAVRLGVRDADEVLVDVQTDEKSSSLAHG